MKRSACLFIMPFFFVLMIKTPVLSQSNNVNLPAVLLRVDDIGMNHSVNVAIEKLAASGIPFSTSVMFACPWYQEAVEILREYPAVSVGVHLTLNAEWKHYRWGPILGQSAVPSLVDSLGYFHPSVTSFLKSNYNLDEVEKELSAQIERALRSGVKIDYVDYHMGTAVSTPELRAIVEKLAKKYNLGISNYFDENYKSMWGVSVETKKEELFNHLNNLNRDKINLIEFHVAIMDPEMNALVDLNSDLMNSAEGKPMAGEHRQTELGILLSPEFVSLINKNFRLVTYADVIRESGLEIMKPSVRYTKED